MVTSPQSRGQHAIDRILPVAFALWATLCLGSTVFAITALTAGSAVACNPGQCRFPQLTVNAAEAIEDWPPGLTGYAAIVAAISTVTALVPLILGTIVVVWGHGRARYVMAAVWFALAFGAFSAWTPLPVIAWVVTPVGLAGLFWLMAGFPGTRPSPKWTAIPAALLSVWAVVTWGIPPISESIARAEAPWSQLVGPVFIVGILAIMAGKALRYRSSTPPIRRWYRILAVAMGIMLVIGAGGAMLTFIPGYAYGSVGGNVGNLLSNLSTAALFAVLAAATVRDGGYGVRPALNHVLFGAILLGIAVLAYSATAWALASAAAVWLPPAVAAVATALVLAAVFGRLARMIDRLVYGDAAEPSALVAALTVELASAKDSEDAVPAVLRQLVHRLRLTSAVLELPDGEVIATHPASTDLVSNAHVDLTLAGGSLLGTINVGLRPGQPWLSRRDRRALLASAAPIQAALAARRLVEKAADAGRSLATVREVERRNLRRQLHDDVGPDLAIAKHRVSAASRDLVQDPDAAAAHLDGATRAISLGLDRIREISRELRPPALDHGNLISALRHIAEGSGLRFEGPSAPPRVVEDAVEVTLYRVGVEAITNAARHGGAQSVRIGLYDRNNWAELTVADDGAGLPEPFITGVGVASMRERVGELGGTISFGESESGGLLVTCRVPVAQRGADQ
jgi:two-component system NarL family sensor kinase